MLKRRYAFEFTAYWCASLAVIGNLLNVETRFLCTTHVSLRALIRTIKEKRRGEGLIGTSPSEEFTADRSPLQLEIESILLNNTKISCRKERFFYYLLGMLYKLRIIIILVTITKVNSTYWYYCIFFLFAGSFDLA